MENSETKMENNACEEAKPEETCVSKVSLLAKRGSIRSSAKLNDIDCIPPGSEGLANLSCPPTEHELKSFKDIPAEALPKKYTRDQSDRVFVNRNLYMDKIDWIGFDMDYTLAVYKSPAFEAMTYSLLVTELVNMGYPSEISQFQFDPNFAIRGLFLDIKYGNLIKLDAFCNIIVAVHGHTILSPKECKRLYPSNFIAPDFIGSKKRYQGLNTLFDIPKTALFADLVAFMSKARTECLTGIQVDRYTLSFRNMVADLEACVDVIHNQGFLKKETMSNLDKYVEKDPRLHTLLQRIQMNGKHAFIATNSDYYYTNKIMKYLFEGTGVNWKSMFDVIIVNACKPLFFSEGTSLREVNEDTGSLLLGTVTGQLEPGKVYSGGSSDIFCQLTGAQPQRTLYIGDHIFGDILKSKKMEGWRTFLVVPELARDMSVWKEQQRHYTHLRNLEFIVAETYRDMDSDCRLKPDTTELINHIKATSAELDNLSNKYFGSLFRSGSHLSFFAMQTQRYADLYAPSHLNLL
eukprot:Ihof_evm10s37 gene=Ihof_evmTU10s37